MLVSPALAGHPMVNTGSSGGANALLIILGALITLGIAYMTWKKWRRKQAARDDTDVSKDA